MKKDVYKLTNPQKNILEMEQVNSGNNSINHILSILKLSGKLNTEILEKTIKIIIEKNDSFHINIEKINESYKQYFSKPNIFYIHPELKIFFLFTISNFSLSHRPVSL